MESKTKNYILAETPTHISISGDKIIEEFIGNVNTAAESVSVARVEAPNGWNEPRQAPEFNGITIMLKESLQVEKEETTLTLSAGLLILTKKYYRVRYSNPFAKTAVYWVICIPACSTDKANRNL